MDGRRRLDRILDDHYLDGFEERPTDEIRVMRDECEEEESGISFARRVVQGKLDILRAEALRRRDAETDPEGVHRLLDSLPRILSDEVSATPLRSRVTRFLVPPAVEYHRRDVEKLVGEHVLTNLPEKTVDELTELVQMLDGREHELSTLRRSLLDRIDALQDELARRYKSGSADVLEVLPRRV